MKNLILIGAGGFFRELFEYISMDIEKGYLSGVCLKGILADNIPQDIMPIEYLGSIADYIPDSNDVFMIAIGNPQVRSKIYKEITVKNGVFYSYIHSSCHISPSAKIGDGVIICPNSIVNANSIIAKNVAINVFCSIGHDSSIDSHSVLSPYVSVSGSAHVGKECFLGTRATLFPSAIMRNMSSIDAHTYAKGIVDEKHILFVKNEYKTVKNRFLDRE